VRDPDVLVLPIVQLPSYLPPAAVWEKKWDEKRQRKRAATRQAQHTAQGSVI